MKLASSFLILLFLCTSCKKNKSERDDFILLSDQEAPLGWIYFTIYSDSTFQYTSRGLRDREVYKGKALIKNDSIYLNYYDSTPIVGKTIFYTEKYLEFTDMKPPYRITIRLNKLNERIRN